MFGIWNILAVVFLIVMMILGFVHGVLRRILSFASVTVCFVVAWMLSGSLADSLQILPSSMKVLVGTPLELFASLYMNRALWMIALFIVLCIVVAILKVAFKAIRKTPVIGFVNGVLGAVFGIVEWFVYMVVFCLVLKLPILPFGQDALQAPIIQTVDNISNTILFTDDLNQELNVIGKIIDSEKLTNDEINFIVNKGESIGIPKDTILKYLDSLK